MKSALSTLAALVAAGLLVACGRREAAETRPAQTAPPAPAAAALPDPGYRVTWGSVTHPEPLVAGRTVPFEVSVTNSSDRVWADVPTSADPATGREAVRLSYRIFKAGAAEPLRDYRDRIDLKAPLPPGASAVLSAGVELPGEPGTYEVQFDLVSEFVAWFEARGAPRNVSRIEVVSGR